jgi:hypothetical protein
MDAHRREVFTALYRVADAPLGALARLVEVDPAAVGTGIDGRTMERWASVDLFIGDGAVLYKEIIKSRAVASPLLAGTMGTHGGRPCPAGETLDPAGVYAVRQASGRRDRT